MFRNTLKIITGAAAALAAVLAAAAIINRKRRKADNTETEGVTIDSDEIIVNGIAGNAPVYVGLYEGLYNIAYKDSKVLDSVEEWLVRTENLSDCENYKTIIQAYLGDYRLMDDQELKEKTEHLVSLIFEAGLVRRNTDDVDINSVNDKEYQILGDASAAEEKGYTVIKAAWEYNGSVIEPGAILIS